MRPPSTPRPALGRGLAVLIPLAILAGACEATPVASPSASPTTTASEAGSLRASSPSGSPASLPSGPDAVRVVRVAAGLVAPIGITNAGDGSGRLYVNQQAGQVRIVEANGTLRPQPFVDLSDRIVAGGEQGLLGLAFHPNFARTRRIFVDYTRRPDGATVISELRAATGGLSADPASERILLVIPQPYANHNGGQLAFGPDGFLYVGMGDGGSAGDPHRNGQNRNALLGKILRIDVDGPHTAGKQYAIPPSNPFASGGGAPEVWAYGLRNPWRFSFDPRGGDLYIGDVGQNAWEEIDRQPASSRGGENYGWNIIEGNHCFAAAGCDQQGLVGPIAEYGHDQGCSVTGGYVYRGAAQPTLGGVYLFGDYCSGLIFTLQVDKGTMTPKLVLRSGLSISSFGVGENGEIYVADLRGGSVYRIVAVGG